MTVLNSLVADQLLDFHNKLIKKIDAGDEKRLAAIEILRDYIKVSKKIRFEGDGYSLNWEKEAKKRGLSHVRDTPRALDFLITKKSKDLFKRHGVLNETEILARHEIMLENYIMKVQIEARVIGDLALNHIIPTAIINQNKLISNFCHSS